MGKMKPASEGCTIAVNAERDQKAIVHLLLLMPHSKH
jgi:hypothetical protein